MTEDVRLGYAEKSPAMEEYHRGLTGHSGAGGSHGSYARADRDRVGCVIRAFVRLESRPSWSKKNRNFV